MTRSTQVLRLSVPALALAGLILTTGATAYAQGRGGGGAPARPSTPGAGFSAPRSFTPPSHATPAPTHATPAATARPNQPAARPERSAATPARQLADDMKAINQAAFNERQALLKDADLSLAANREALQKIQSDTRTMRAEARENFQTALADVKARDAELAEAIKGAQNTDAPGWNQAREKLAAAHQHYLDARARLEEARRHGETPDGK